MKIFYAEIVYLHVLSYTASIWHAFDMNENNLLSQKFYARNFYVIVKFLAQIFANEINTYSSTPYLCT